MNFDIDFNELKGKSVFISGGGSGIGASLTEGFLSQGAKVTFVQRSDASDFVASMKEKYNNEPLFVPCDITDIDALHNAMDKASDAFGEIEVLVNNAANDTRHLIEDVTNDYWDKAMDVNLKHQFFASQYVRDGMKKQGGGSIINYSSISYIMGNGGYAVYETAKSAIIGLTRSMARELGPEKIRVNSILPGWVLTQRQLDLWASEEALEAHKKKICLNQHLEPHDMIGVTLFLASNLSKMMTGQAIIVDGGVVFTG